MAIAVNGGHVSRALDFYRRNNKYFIIGGSNSNPWTNDNNPDSPTVEDFRLRDVIGLKKVTKTRMVVKDDNGSIVYRNQNWREVLVEFETTLKSGVSANSTTLSLTDVVGLKEGDKLRIDNLYEGIIVSKQGTTITLDTAAPSAILTGAKVLGGAIVEGARYVYVEGVLEYNNFPLASYRQIGLCTEVDPKTPNADVLRAAAYNNSTGVDEFNSLGTLEILDNRAPITRDISMKEQISMVIEF